MNSKQRLNYVLAASLATMIMTVAVGRLVSFDWLSHAFDYDRIGYYITAIVVPALVLVVAAIPGLFLLRYKRVPHYISLGLAAPILAFCFSFTFIPLLALYAIWWVSVANFVFIAAAYFLADTVLNRWGARFRFKILAMVGIAVFTVLLDRIFVLFY